MEKRIIGITGGIGSGKSVVSRILRLNGFAVYDCDYEAKRIMGCDAGVRSALCDILGDGAYDAHGNPDRKYIAGLIFSNAEMLARVNGVVHASVRDHFRIFARESSSETVFCESAILASSGFAGLCDSVWLVEAPVGLRIERVMRRSAMSADEVMQRMAAQSDEMAAVVAYRPSVIRNADDSGLLQRIMNLLNNDYEIKELICLEKF